MRNLPTLRKCKHGTDVQGALRPLGTQRCSARLGALARAYVAKGAIADAIGHFKKGLYCDTKSEREELGLYFELGAAYELLHDPKEALYYFQKVQKRDAGFRNAAARVRALAQPRPAPPPPAPSATDDVDRAFDDLMGGGDEG